MIDNRVSRAFFTATLFLLQAFAFASAAQPSAPQAAVQQLMDKELAGVPGKEILMLAVEYLPGGASLPHRHDAVVCVYVLEGELNMQVEGGPLLKLGPGQIFYEGPNDVHTVSANASKTAPAKILVFIVKDKNAPVTREVTPKGTP